MIGIPGGIEWLMMLVVFRIVMILLFWRILKRAGLSGALALLALIPGFGPLLLLCVMALAEWPVLHERREARGKVQPRENQTEHSNPERKNR